MPSQAVSERNAKTTEECRKLREHAGFVLAQAQDLLERLDRSNGRLGADYQWPSLTRNEEQSAAFFHPLVRGN